MNFFKRNGSKRHTLITVNARCKQTAQLTAKLEEWNTRGNTHPYSFDIPKTSN